MSEPMFPLGRPAFVTDVLDRAAHLRLDDEKLFALEGRSDSRAYLVYRDSLVMMQEADGPRALLTIAEALKCGANPGTIFLVCAARRRCLAWASHRCCRHVAHATMSP